MHEKAILLVLIPFTLVALRDRRHYAAYLPLAVAGHVSLFPLLFTMHEWLLKIGYTMFWLFAMLPAFNGLAPRGNVRRIFLLDRLVGLYIALGALVALYASVHGVLWGGRLEFVPLMLVSVYSACGVVGSWVGLMVVFFTS